MSNALDINKIRKDFPALHQEVNGKPLIYFDNAATSQKPQIFIDAVKNFYERDCSNVHRGLHELSNRATVAYENSRKTIAQTLNAKYEEIIFTRGTTESLNLIAHSWGDQNINEGEIILITEMEHHSNIIPWQLLAQRKKAKLDYVSITPEGLLDETDLEKKISQPRVKLLSLVHISNTLGTINPVKKICVRAKSLGITTVIDGAQSFGHMKLDLQDLGCDFFAFSAHKCCGPTGIGGLYGRKELLDAMPPFLGGGEMISFVDYQTSTYKDLPSKFEAGTPAIAEAISWKASVDYLNEMGLDKIQQHCIKLAEYAYQKLSEIPHIKIIGPKTGRMSLVSFSFEDIHPHDIVTYVNEEGLALRGGHACNQITLRKLGLNAIARMSFYFYNTKEEVDAAVQILHNMRKFFRCES
jgi:cysteine desulfurase/selenocysteine lyase